MKNLKCPNCGEPLTEILGSDSYRLFSKDNKWHKEESASELICGNCHEYLDNHDLEDIMKAVGLL